MKLARPSSRQALRSLVYTLALSFAVVFWASPSLADSHGEEATIQLGSDDLGKSREELGDRSLAKESEAKAAADDQTDKPQGKRGKDGKCKKCGKKGECKGKDGQCPLGKKGECKGKDGECPMKKAGACKGKDGECPLKKAGVCKGKDGQCPMKKGGGCCKKGKQHKKGKRMGYQRCVDASILAGNGRDESTRVCRAAFPNGS
ncbi:MAG: hypothetical protein QF570_01355 [Myxococcota bacterium]|nr:hypothetical protein [Myxococcota bacterium]